MEVTVVSTQVESPQVDSKLPKLSPIIQPEVQTAVSPVEITTLPLLVQIPTTTTTVITEEQDQVLQQSNENGEEKQLSPVPVPTPTPRLVEQIIQGEENVKVSPIHGTKQKPSSPSPPIISQQLPSTQFLLSSSCFNHANVLSSSPPTTTTTTTNTLNSEATLRSMRSSLPAYLSSATALRSGLSATTLSAATVVASSAPAATTTPMAAVVSSTTKEEEQKQKPNSPPPANTNTSSPSSFLTSSTTSLFPTIISSSTEEASLELSKPPPLPFLHSSFGAHHFHRHSTSFLPTKTNSYNSFTMVNNVVNLNQLRTPPSSPLNLGSNAIVTSTAATSDRIGSILNSSATRLGNFFSTFHSQHHQHHSHYHHHHHHHGHGGGLGLHGGSKHTTILTSNKLSQQMATTLQHRSTIDFNEFITKNNFYNKTQNEMAKPKSHQDFLSLSLSPPLNRRTKDIPALRGFVSL